MKIIHTADWHLGQSLCRYDRSDEHAAFLSQLSDTIDRTRPDVLIVSGDIFHTSSPSASVQRMFNEALLGIMQQHPHMTAVIIAGNHDSGMRLETGKSLWECFRVHVVGCIPRHPKTGCADLDRLIIPVCDTDGNTIGFVAAVPHVYPQNFPAVGLTNDSRTSRMESFFKALRHRVGQLNPDGLPVVLSAHLAVTGADMTGHRDLIGGMDYVQMELLGRNYDYIALGHIHCPQTLKGSDGRVRYSGSPLQVNFDENYPHSVTVVTIDPGKPVEQHTEPIISPMPCLTIPSEPAPIEEALEALGALPADRKAYVRLNVLTDKFLPPSTEARVLQLMQGKQARFCYINISRRTVARNEGGHMPGLEEIRTISPIEIAAMYLRDHNGMEMDNNTRSMLAEAIRLAGQESHAENRQSTSALS